MTIVLVAFRDDAGRAVTYRKFSGANCVYDASMCYQKLLHQARMLSRDRKPRVISTRIIVP